MFARVFGEYREGQIFHSLLYCKFDVPSVCYRVFGLYSWSSLNEDIDVSRETWKGITYGKSDSDC